MAIYKNKIHRFLDKLLPFKKKRLKILKSILPYSYTADWLINIPKIRAWEKKYQPEKVLENRFRLYDYLNQEILQNDKITFLEFGVFEGTSIKYWAKIHQHLESKFVGFDTFTGLPEDWLATPLHTHDNTEYDAGGIIPKVSDERISFVKGLFQETLGEFANKFNPTSRLIIHSDSDLYSSTLFVLSKLDKYIIPGTIVIFDEFNSPLTEFKAFIDYSSAYMRTYRTVCSTPNLVQMVVEFT